MTSFVTPLNAPIVSIAIPTYNRAKRLEETLNRLSVHPEIFWDAIELVISDNASEDETGQVVSDFIARTGKSVRFRRNASNLGIDGNIHAVSHLATGKYMLLMSDDDLLRPGALTTLLNIVDSNPELLFCFVNGGSFHGTYQDNATLPSLVNIQKPLITKDPNELLRTIWVWSTFISSFFVNRDAWVKVPNQESFIGSDIYLTHVLFRMLASNRGRTSVVTAEQLVSARAEYTGNFRVFHAFGHSFLKLLSDEAPGFGLDARAMRAIKLNTIRRALPPMVLMMRRGAKPRFLNRQELGSLLRYTWWEPLSWIFLLPVALLPSSVIDGLMWIKRKLFKRSVFS